MNGHIEKLRLHVDGHNNVWYGDDYQLGVNSNLDVNDFFNSDTLGVSLCNVNAIYVIGNKQNASLIIYLNALRNAKKLDHQKIHLCPPTIIPIKALRDDPETVLQHMWQSATSDIWHAMTENDYVTYVMISNMPPDGLEVPEVIKRIAEYHPAWPALTFISTLDINIACRLICEIVDPRWYKHQTRPNRITKLCNYLGVIPQNMSFFCGDESPGRHNYRAMLAVRSWYNQRVLTLKERGPSDFLISEFNKASSKATGLLHCTRRLVRLIYSAWLYAIGWHHPEAFFSPERFFNKQEEIVAFNKHLSSKSV